jgi:hypothetical protein
MGSRSFECCTRRQFLTALTSQSGRLLRRTRDGVLHVRPLV